MIEKVRGSGHLVISEMVTDGNATWLHSEQFYGYGRKTAMLSYSESVARQGWKLAR